MQTVSRDGIFIVSASDSSKVGCRLMSNGETEETKFDKENDVYLEVIEGKEASMYDVAYTIFLDCFSTDDVGLLLLAKTLNCHVKVGCKTYTFRVENPDCMDIVLKEISSQLKL